MARKRASIQLARLLDDRIKAGFTHIIAIGHSHGGNVIVDALPYTNTHSKKITIITLATPFVAISVKQKSSSEKLLYRAGYFLSLALLTNFINILFRQDTSIYVTIFTFISCLLLYVSTEYRIASELSEPAVHESGLVFQKPPDFVDSQTTHLFAFRSQYDEASVALGLCSFVARHAVTLPNLYILVILFELAGAIPIFLIWGVVGIGNTIKGANGAIFSNTILWFQVLMLAIPLRAEVWAITRCAGILTAIARRGGAVHRVTLILHMLLLRISDRHSCNVAILLASVILTFAIAEMQYTFGYVTWQPSVSYSMAIAVTIGLLAPIYAAFGVLMLRMAVGPELFFHSLNIEAVVGTMPANRIPATLIMIRPIRSTILRHFIYENPACRERVIELLRECAN